MATFDFTEYDENDDYFEARDITLLIDPLDATHLASSLLSYAAAKLHKVGSGAFEPGFDIAEIPIPVECTVNINADLRVVLRRLCEDFAKNNRHMIEDAEMSGHFARNPDELTLCHERIKALELVISLVT